MGMTRQERQSQEKARRCCRVGPCVGNAAGAIARAQTEADLAQRRFMLVDPNNRLVADTLGGEWNEKLRILAKAREERERTREHDQFILDEAVRERLVAMTVDFNKLWVDPDTPNCGVRRLPDGIPIKNRTRFRELAGRDWSAPPD
ncbi:hypothetical protein [Mesorhizobium sp.]|uniref:hypothetical protein n=1 Tax=Mesorhizobium sp. TaxID=1871066 RepID=UPI0025F59B93|nr:hypothetical protein [Mesorhizobium sp.]